MLSSKDMDPKVRFLVLLQEADMKLSRIDKVIGKPSSIVYDWKKFEKNINFLNIRPKTFKKIDTKTRHSIARQAQRSSKPLSSRQIGAKYHISQTNVCDILKDKGLKYVKEEKRMS